MSSGKLKKFSIVFTSDVNRGISKGGRCPWTSQEDANFVRTTTVGKKKNVVIVGRITYEKILKEEPLVKRTTYVISRTYSQQNHPGVHIFPSIREALSAAALGSFDEVFIIGGVSIFKEITERWMYLCEAIHWTQFKMDYKCDEHFSETVLDKIPEGKDPTKTQTMIRHFLKPNFGHKEVELLKVFKRLLTPEGGILAERHLYGVNFDFLLTDTFPFLTTNQVDTNGAFSLFLMALKGVVDVETIRDQEVNGIYASLKDATSIASHDAKGTGLEEGDMGPWWGWISRHWGVGYEGKDAVFSNQGDLLVQAIDGIKSSSRKALVTFFDPSQSEFSAVHTRYASMEFVASPDRAYLDVMVHLYSSEVIEDLKMDVAIFGLYLVSMALMVGCRPRALKFMVNDLWARRSEPVEKQIARTPLPFPKLSVRNSSRIRGPDDPDMNSWMLKFYESWSVISPVREDLIKIKK